MRVICDTYKIIHRVGSSALTALKLPDGLTVARFPQFGDAGVEIQLGSELRLRKEGELAIILRDIREKRPILSLALAFEQMSSHQIVCYLGCLQGSVGAQASIKQLTKSMHGLRPSALLVLVAQQIAQQHGATKLFGVGNKIQVYRRKHLMHSRLVRPLHFDYDAFWQAYGGKQTDSGWFEIPLTSRRRSRGEVASKKRAQYLRRYRLIDGLYLQLLTNADSANMNAERAR